MTLSTLIPPALRSPLMIALSVSAVVILGAFLPADSLRAQMPCESCWNVYDSTNAPFDGRLVWSMAMDSGGGVWVGGNGARLHRFDGKSWSSVDMTRFGLPEYPIQGLAIDRKGTFWMTCRGLLVRWDGRDSVAVIPLDRDSTYAIPVAVDPDGSTVWIGTHYQGLYVYRKGAVEHVWGNWHRTGSSEGMEMWNVDQMTFDRKGTLWFATRRGVWSFDGRKFAHYDTSNSSIRHPVIYNISFANDGAMWTAGYPALNICRYDNGRWEEFPSIGGWMQEQQRGEGPRPYVAWGVIALPGGGVLATSQTVNAISIWRRGLWHWVGVPEKCSGIRGMAPALVDRRGGVWMRTGGPRYCVVRYDPSGDTLRPDPTVPVAVRWPQRHQLEQIRRGARNTNATVRNRDPLDLSDPFEGGLGTPAVPSP